MLTDGSCDIDELFNFASKEVAEEYIVSEINKVYELQGAAISRKHVEVIIKQMFGRVKIVNPGDTRFTQSDVVEISTFRAENARVKGESGTEAKGKHLVLGITDVALSTDSWLAAGLSIYEVPRRMPVSTVRWARIESGLVTPTEAELADFERHVLRR